MDLLLFRFDDYYPAGGAKDLVGSFDSIEKARVALGPARIMDNAHVFSLSEGRIVAAWRYSRDLDDWEESTWDIEYFDEYVRP